MDVWCVCVCVCVFLCLCTGRKSLRRGDHPPKESPAECPRYSKPKWNGEFHGGRPRPKLRL
jgi:hypothetical protein